MYNMSKKICLVIPCFNEESRLDFNKLLKKRNSTYFIFVNDGSTDNTYLLLQKNLKRNFYILNLEKNHGKAEAIRQGILFLKTLPIYKKIEWIGFWDADLSTSLEELKFFFKYLSIFDKKVDAIFGSRIYKLGSKIKRSYLRHISGRVFATIVGFLLKIQCYDSQCGAKLFRKNLINIAFNKPFISKWIFDIEIILRLKNQVIIEYPLMFWHDCKGSKIRIIPDIIEIILDLFKIRKCYF